mmetsp:Transcript_26570/g.50342  ORF Transcript_26570/g.50342 Transcript_26570/m.50342 type:complete len:221 (-) Transcript_26570:16-678(-)
MWMLSKCIKFRILCPLISVMKSAGIFTFFHLSNMSFLAKPPSLSLPAIPQWVNFSSVHVPSSIRTTPSAPAFCACRTFSTSATVPLSKRAILPSSCPLFMGALLPSLGIAYTISLWTAKSWGPWYALSPSMCEPSELGSTQFLHISTVIRPSGWFRLVCFEWSDMYTGWTSSSWTCPATKFEMDREGTKAKRKKARTNPRMLGVDIAGEISGNGFERLLL